MPLSQPGTLCSIAHEYLKCTLCWNVNSCQNVFLGSHSFSSGWKNEVPGLGLIFTRSQSSKFLIRRLVLTVQNEFVLQMSFLFFFFFKCENQMRSEMLFVQTVCCGHGNRVRTRRIAEAGALRWGTWESPQQTRRPRYWGTRCALGGMSFLSFGAGPRESASKRCSSSAWVVRWWAF